MTNRANTYTMEREIINQIENSTIAKLTTKEACLMGLANCGFGFYKGELKARRNGITRKSNDGVTFTYENDMHRVEFTELVSEGETREWAARVYNKEREQYETYPMGIFGCQFIK